MGEEEAGVGEHTLEQGQETGQSDRGQLLADIRRLSRVVLDKLEQGAREGTLDQGQIRLLGSIAMRSLGLWQETLNTRPRRSPRRGLEETEDSILEES